MKRFSLYILLTVFAISLSLTACDTEDELLEKRKADNPAPSPVQPETGEKGNADFSTYVAIGNYSEGLMGGAVYTNSQKNSFPIMLGEQFQRYVGGGDFNVPEVHSENGFNFFTSLPGGAIAGKFVLDLTLESPAPVPVPGEALSPFTGDKSKVNNFGIPGVTLLSLDNAALGGPLSPANPLYNPFYARFASAPGSSTVLGDAIARKPTFFTFWMGATDLLFYAIGGASNDLLLTSDGAFKSLYESAIGRLMNETEATGVVLNIPPITATPFFQAVPRTGTVPEEKRQALKAGLDGLNAAITGWNAAVNADNSLSEAQKKALQRPTLSTNFDNYPFLIVDSSLPDTKPIIPDGQGGFLPIPKIRNIDPTPGTGELIVFTAAPEIPKGIGISPLTPLPDSLVLTKEEIAQINQSLVSFNTTIATTVAANSERIALVDVIPVFKDLVGLDGSEKGIVIGSDVLAPDFSPSGFYSPDGIHPNPRGYAYIANLILEATEKKYSAKLPKLDVMSRRGPLLKLFND